MTYTQKILVQRIRTCPIDGTHPMDEFPVAFLQGKSMLSPPWRQQSTRGFFAEEEERWSELLRRGIAAPAPAEAAGIGDPRG